MSLLAIPGPSFVIRGRLRVRMPRAVLLVAQGKDLV